MVYLKVNMNFFFNSKHFKESIACPINCFQYLLSINGIQLFWFFFFN
jgi:hypothetical protein